MPEAQKESPIHPIKIGNATYFVCQKCNSAMVGVNDDGLCGMCAGGHTPLVQITPINTVLKIEETICGNETIKKMEANPCKKCGGEPLMAQVEAPKDIQEWSAYVFYAIWCRNDNCENFMRFPDHVSKISAIRDWNDAD